MQAKRVAAVVAVVTAAAAGALAVQRARQARPAPTGPVHFSGRAARNAAMAKVGTKAGGAFALHKARRTFASADRRRELDTEFEMKTAEQITEALGNMKGALMKLGQMASYLDQGMPEHVRVALAELQQNAPPMSAELAAGVVEAELGAPPAEVFAEWDERPIASASIGQVHRAMTHDGRAVAVKVQYPGIAEAIASDLDNTGMIFGAIGMLFPGLETGPIVTELRDRLGEELDYCTEAANQQLFVDYYAGHPYIHVPAVLHELSTGKVLTTDLADGVHFSEALTWDQAERDLAAETIYRFVFRSLYRMHAFNGDPHPGNYLFRPGGQVTFLDFGLVKRFAPHEVTILADLVQAIVIDRDTTRFREEVERSGFVPDTSSISDEALIGYMQHFYEFVLEDGVQTITPEWSSESVRRFFDTGGEHGEIIRAANVPAAFVIIQRINLGLGAILGDLRATANFRRIAEELWPFVDGPPSTPMGEAEAVWLAGDGGQHGAGGGGVDVRASGGVAQHGAHEGADDG